VNNGDVVNVRQSSSASNSVTTSSTLSIGGIVAVYNVTTPAPAPDTTPDSFSFIAQDGALLGTEYVSSTITVSGINQSSSISISGSTGEYDINDLNAYVSTTGTVQNGDSISLKALSSSTP
jgi:hypothetical protein